MKWNKWFYAEKRQAKDEEQKKKNSNKTLFAKLRWLKYLSGVKIMA